MHQTVGAKREHLCLYGQVATLGPCYQYLFSHGLKRICRCRAPADLLELINGATGRTRHLLPILREKRSGRLFWGVHLVHPMNICLQKLFGLFYRGDIGFNSVSAAPAACSLAKRNAIFPRRYRPYLGSDLHSRAGLAVKSDVASLAPPRFVPLAAILWE